MKPSLPELQAFQIIIGISIGLGLAVVLFVVGAWILTRKPKVKIKKNYSKVIGMTLDLDESELKMLE